MEECNHKYETASEGNQFFKRILPENMKEHQLCAGSVDDFVRTTFGDSGDPMTRRKWSKSGDFYELIAIVSGGFSFADDLYCFIAHEKNLEWIFEILKNIAGKVVSTPPPNPPPTPKPTQKRTQKPTQQPTQKPTQKPALQPKQNTQDTKSQ